MKTKGKVSGDVILVHIDGKTVACTAKVTPRIDSEINTTIRTTEEGNSFVGSIEPLHKRQPIKCVVYDIQGDTIFIATTHGNQAASFDIKDLRDEDIEKARQLNRGDFITITI